MLFFLKKSAAILGILSLLVLPSIAFAQPVTPTPSPAPTPAPATPPATPAAPAPSQTMHLSIPIGSTTEVSNLAQYIVVVYRYALGIVTTVAIIMVVYGGFQYLLGATVSSVKNGQKTIQDAIGGMVVLLLAYVILYTVNPATVSLRMPGVAKISEVGVSEATQASAYRNVTGGSCAVDADCPAGGACLRTSAVGGLCASGVAGNICKCKAGGCEISDEQAHGPTNNSAAQAPVRRGTFPCQSGLTCAQVGDGDWQCAGGAFSVCNDSTETIQHIDNAPVVDAIISGGTAGAQVTRSSLQGNILYRPFMSLASGIGATAGGAVGALRALPETYQSSVREAFHCTEPGQYCLQPYEGRAGACVYGDQRDAAVFDGIQDDIRRNPGLQQLIDNCSSDDYFVRHNPVPYGGCQAVGGAVDAYCVAHRYQCRNGAICTQDLDIFQRTIRAYGGGISNVPHLLSPAFYLVPGCKRPIGQSCTSDRDCATGSCVNGMCPGFRFLDLVDGKVAGEACSSGSECLSGNCTAQSGGQRCQALLSAGVESGIRREDLPLIKVSQTLTGCPDATWSAADLYQQAVLSRDTTKMEQAIGVLNRIQGRSAFACYPLRANGEHCDFDAQCTSANCSVEPTSAIPLTFSHPLDRAVGAGTCLGAPATP